MSNLQDDFQQENLKWQLRLAIVAGSVDDVFNLIDRGANVNLPTHAAGGPTHPLAEAIRSDNPDKVTALLYAGANPLQHHKTGTVTMPLSDLARIYKNPHIIKYIEKAENLTKPDTYSIYKPKSL
jgi:hypothetical protein